MNTTRPSLLLDTNPDIQVETSDAALALEEVEEAQRIDYSLARAHSATNLEFITMPLNLGVSTRIVGHDETRKAIRIFPIGTVSSNSLMSHLWISREPIDAYAGQIDANDNPSTAIPGLFLGLLYAPIEIEGSTPLYATVFNAPTAPRSPMISMVIERYSSGV